MTSPEPAVSTEGVERLLHELQVHQEELLIQNEELRRVRAEVEAALARYADLYEFAPIAYLTLDRQGAIVDVNLTGSALLRSPRTQLRGRPFRRFVEVADLARFDKMLLAAETPDAGPMAEIGIVTGEGTPLSCDLSVGRDPHTGTTLLALLDRTEQRRTEDALRLAGQQLADSQRLEAIGRLAGGVAHDFNNTLTAINGISDMIAEGLGPTDPLRADIEVIRESGRHAAALTHQLLAFGRRLPLQPTSVALAEAISRITPLLRRTLGEDTVLTLHLQAELPPVHVDLVQFEQVLVNLVFNARDAMPDGGTVEVTLTRLEVTPDVVAVHPDASSRAHVRLSVTDSGVGIAPDVLAHLFEPFFTTKELGRGTGLGLATVEGIVAQSGGWIDVSSIPGSGSTFSVVLPCTVPEPQPMPETTEPAAAGHATILLVEDQANVRAVASRMLRSLGYTVIAMDGPEGALSLDAATFAAVDLLVTDAVMPHMSGERLADLLVQRRPALPVLFVSGFSPEAVLHGRVARLNEAFLAKPFTRSQLASACQSLLDRDRPGGPAGSGPADPLSSN